MFKTQFANQQETERSRLWNLYLQKKWKFLLTLPERLPTITHKLALVLTVVLSPDTGKEVSSMKFFWFGASLLVLVSLFMIGCGDSAPTPPPSTGGGIGQGPPTPKGAEASPLMSGGADEAEKMGRGPGSGAVPEGYRDQGQAGGGAPGGGPPGGGAPSGGGAPPQ